MYEISDYLNIASIICEIVGFVLLLPRLNDWLKRKNRYSANNMMDIDFLLEELKKDNFEKCKKFFESNIKYSFSEEKFQKFMSVFKEVHDIWQIPYEERRKNNEYFRKSRYVKDELIKDHANRVYYPKHRNLETFAIGLVIIGLIGQAMATIL